MRKYDGFGDGHSKHFAEGDCEELMDAAKSMFESRRVVKFTCVPTIVCMPNATGASLSLSRVTWRLQNSYVREFLLEKAIFLLEDEHGPESEVVVSKRAQLSLFKQWQEPYINAIDKLSEMIERPDAVRLLKPVRFVVEVIAGCVVLLVYTCTQC
jgi:hypothetical protein|eukprot:COSAG02_NODE_632_length_19286_cov_1518.762235_5_plen_155_part_00